MQCNHGCHAISSHGSLYIPTDDYDCQHHENQAAPRWIPKMCIYDTRQKLSIHDDFIAEECINYTNKLCKASRLSFFSSSLLSFLSTISSLSSSKKETLRPKTTLILLKCCNPFLISDFCRVVELHICNRNVLTIYFIYAFSRATPSLHSSSGGGYLWHSGGICITYGIYGSVCVCVLLW